MAPIGGDEPDGPWTEGGSDLDTPLPRAESSSAGDTGRPSTEPPDISRSVEANPSGNTVGEPTGGEQSKRSPRGGIAVRFDNPGDDEYRAKYVVAGREIIVNLDHPQIVAALSETSRDISDPRFTKLTWEVAISEYAVALARMREEKGHYIAMKEPLFDVRDTTDRLARKIWAKTEDGN